MNKNTLIPNFSFFFLLSGLHLGIVLSSGVLTSGYHFIDDHRFIQMDKDFSEVGFIEVVDKVVREDLTWRFRPIYSFLQTLECYLFGKNFLLWELSRSFYALLTGFFLYLGLKGLGFSFLSSGVFSLFSLYNRAAPIWWRLGNNETYGMLFLSLAILFLSSSCNPKEKKLGSFLFYGFAMLSSLSKETFILILPSLIIARIWLEFLYQEKKDFKAALFSIRQTLFGNIFLLALFVLEVLAIKYGVGTETMGYAGVEGVSFSRYMSEFVHLNKLCYLNIPLGIFLLFFVLNRASIKRFYQGRQIEIFFFFFLFLSIILPQVISYAKIGFYERYIVPSALAYAFLTAVSVTLLRTSRKNQELSHQNAFPKKLNLWLTGCFILLSLLFLFPAFQNWLGEVYSLYRGRPTKDHFFIKVTLTGIFLFVIGLYRLLSSGRLASRLFRFQQKYFLNTMPMKIVLVLLLLNLGDRSVTAFRDARSYREQGDFIKAFSSVLEEGRLREQTVLLVSDPIESEFLYSLPFYLQNQFQNLHFKLKPYNEKEYAEDSFETSLRKGSLRSFRDRMFMGEFEEIHFIFVRKNFLDRFKSDFSDWFSSHKVKVIDNQDYFILYPEESTSN